MDDRSEPALFARTCAFPARRESFGALVDAAEAFGRDSASDGREGWHDFLTAVAEIGGNVLSYAYREGERGEIELSLSRYPQRLEADFFDWGRLFDEQPASPVPAGVDELDDLLLLAERGRGLAIARAALSTLDYHRTDSGRNHWRLVKQLPPESHR